MGKKTKSVNNKQKTGIDFIRAKKKVGRTIKKQANETDTSIRAKRINLPGQSIAAEFSKGDAVTTRGLSMPELLNQTHHYSGRVRKDALDGVRELLVAHPRCAHAAAAVVVERVAEKLVDVEHAVRVAARGALKLGVLPALGARGLVPFARRLVLHVGAALTHVSPTVRKDAPAVLDALVEAAPKLVGRHAASATTRHLAELLRRGDDAASSSLVSGGTGTGGDTGGGMSGGRRNVNRRGEIASRLRAAGMSGAFGDATASRIGAQARSTHWSPYDRVGVVNAEP